MTTKRGRGDAAPLSCVLAALALATSAAADEIIVTGRQADTRSLRAEAMSFARSVEAAPIEGQIARWNAAVCPSVGGLDGPVAANVAATIRAVATAAGARIGGQGCRANVIVTFTRDARGLVAAMTERRPQLLLAASLPERAFIRDSDAPVRWWYVTGVEGADGTPMAQESEALIGASVEGGSGIPKTGTQAYASTYSSSLIRSPFRASLKGVVVVVDAERATGARLRDVATYVAFVALARIKAPAPIPSTPSILTLFAGGSGGLSRYDAAYLTALYATPVDRAATTQRSRMTMAMVKALAADARGR